MTGFADRDSEFLAGSAKMFDRDLDAAYESYSRALSAGPGRYGRIPEP